MREKLRFGVIGTSSINDMHIKSINSHSRAEVVSLCGRNAAHTQEVANLNGIPHIYTDYRELIGANNLDAVVIGTPDYLHHEMVLLAAKAGLHIACEKPLTQNLDQALEMLKIVESTKVHHLVFFTYRWVPHYARLKQLIGEGYVGRILHAELRYLQNAIPNSEDSYDWHFDPTRGTGVLGNIGSHIIDLAQWLVGDIESVSAFSTAHFNRFGVEKTDIPLLADTVFMTVRFAGDAIGSIHTSACAVTPGQEQLISIRGTDGTLEAGLDGNGAWLKGARAGESLQLIAGQDDLWGEIDITKGSRERFFELIQKRSISDRLLIDDIIAGTQSEPNIRNGASVQAVMEAAQTSSTSECAEMVFKF